MPSVLLLPRAEVPPLVAYVDGYHSEEHTLSVARTDYPVESGATLTDHAVVQPDELVLHGWVSTVLPARRFGAVESNRDLGGDPNLRGAEAWEHVRRLVDTLEPVEMVSTVLGNYSNMLIVNASARANDKTGRSLDFTLTLREVQLGTVDETEGSIASPGPALADRAETETRGLVDPPLTPEEARLARLRALE